MTGHIIKLTQDRLTGEKETHLDSWTGSFIEMGPMKCPEQATFILFGRRNNKLVRNWQDKES